MDWQTRCELPDCSNKNCIYQSEGKCTPNDENFNPENCPDAFVVYEDEDEEMDDDFYWEEEDEDDDDWHPEWEDEEYE